MSYIISEALEDVVVLAGLLHHPHALPPEVQHGGEQVRLHLGGGMMNSSVLSAHPAVVVLYHPVESEEGAGPADPCTAVDQQTGLGCRTLQQLLGLPLQLQDDCSGPGDVAVRPALAM